MMRIRVERASFLPILALLCVAFAPPECATAQTCTAQTGTAQDATTPSESEMESALTTGPRWGFQLGRYQNDFAFGVNLTSPFLDFTDERLAVRLRGNLAFHEHLSGAPGDPTETWTPYANISAGLVGLAGRVGESIRLYGEGGAIGLVPSDAFSGDALAVGGYGVFGFSFFAEPNRSYFIEIGGAGTSARADQLPTDPVYSNGLMIQVGFRSNF
jgi:hypothetical protein